MCTTLQFRRLPRGGCIAGTSWCARKSAARIASSRSGRSPARVPRGNTPERDAELATELLNDPKEIAEHVMLIDLARNDVGPHRADRLGWSSPTRW
ncbi:chorismate-binding protein [Paraburkholderia dipogonis]|uniref:chorismate-binding protein n=1 Tax=Paraburkholderia dipogonis TaxID=1211383 RepID=UPI0035F0A291